MYSRTLLMFICGIVYFAYAQQDTLLKGDVTSNPITVKATTSHKYIANDNQTKIAVLFDISTSDIASLSASSDNNNEIVRDPYELAIVLDRSGSMSGAKIEQSKTAMISIVDNMIEGDVIHIIQYDNAVQTLIRNGGRSSQSEIMRAIQNIQPRGSTNLFGGLSEAYKILKESIAERRKNGASKISHSRIFLFSDGLLNAGITNQKVILDHISRWKNELDLTISTFGIGYDFDRNIMTSIAEQAHGDFFFINSAEAISKVIEIARKDAANIIATEAVLSVRGVDDIHVDVQLNNLFERGRLNMSDNPRFNEIKINDLRAGGAKYVIVELLVNPKNNDVGSEPMDILEWKLSFNPKSDVLDKEVTHSISGVVNIATTDADNEMLQKEENQNEEVVVLWKMNEMTVLDKMIVDDIAGGNYAGAKMKRSQRNSYSKSFYGGSIFQSFLSRFVDSKVFDVVQSMDRRMKKSNIEEKINKLDEMDATEIDNLLFDYKSDVELNQDADYDHEDL